jgi:pimeloyl-ACP methyl ester carboxylesterase
MLIHDGRDTAWQGSSAVLNEERLGSDPHWFDHSRDLLCMINHFRDDMPRPIVGIGHSMGGAQLVFASIFHPRLFLSLVLIEPWITPKSPASGPTLGKNSTFRKDLWSSRQEGEAAMRKRYKIWEPSVLSRMVKYSLRPTPTLLYPDNDAGAVTLATPKHQEAFTIFRPNLENVGIESEPSVEERVTHPDVSLRDDVVKSPFYNTAREQAFYALESLRPTVLYIFGSQSIVATPEFRAEKLRITGTGYLGSGGVKLRQVKEVILSGSHFVPMEKPAAVADEVSKWLGEQMETYRVNEEKLDKGWSQKSAREQQMLSQQWMKSMKAWAGHIPKESKL